MFLIVIHFKLFAIVKCFVIKYILKTEIKVYLADIGQHMESYPTGRINSLLVNRPIRLINVDLEFKKNHSISALEFSEQKRNPNQSVRINHHS